MLNKRVTIRRTTFLSQSPENELESLCRAISEGTEHLPSRPIPLGLDRWLMAGAVDAPPELKEVCAKLRSGKIKERQAAHVYEAWRTISNAPERHVSNVLKLAALEILKLLSESGLSDSATYAERVRAEFAAMRKIS